MDSNFAQRFKSKTGQNITYSFPTMDDKPSGFVGSIDYWGYADRQTVKNFNHLKKELMTPLIKDLRTINMKSLLQAFSESPRLLQTCISCGLETGHMESCGDCEEGTIVCDNCNGDEYIDCNVCDGGAVDCEECAASGIFNVDCEPCNETGEIRVDCEVCDNAIGEVGFVECEECYGTGEDDDGNQCKTCEGEMQVKCEVCGGRGDLMATCPECDGEGEIIEDCEECDGDGDVNCEQCDGDGQVGCEDCGAEGVIECETCYGDWEEKFCNTHKLLEQSLTSQPKLFKLANELNSGSQKLKYIPKIFNDPLEAMAYANKINRFCYVLMLDGRNGFNHGTQTAGAIDYAVYPIHVTTNLNIISPINFELSQFLGNLKIHSNSYKWGYEAIDNPARMVNLEFRWTNSIFQQQIGPPLKVKFTTLVLETNVLLKGAQFMNWNTDSPWTS